jgi:hypothetical protein
MSMLQVGLALAFLLAGAVSAMGLYALRPNAPPWLVQEDDEDRWREPALISNEHRRVRSVEERLRLTVASS